ncbi:Phd1 protein [Maudiozyma humilis]|uniref:Phd1 protein n=1 Tax=Maudiozyma humilis TaxID=51915 RepID=A0AAV5RPV6_MAUHU|nr:Phd1 protein [Kazachstania humilis]
MNANNPGNAPRADMNGMPYQYMSQEQWQYQQQQQQMAQQQQQQQQQMAQQQQQLAQQQQQQQLMQQQQQGQPGQPYYYYYYPQAQAQAQMQKYPYMQQGGPPGAQMVPGQQMQPQQPQPQPQQQQMYMYPQDPQDMRAQMGYAVNPMMDQKQYQMMAQMGYAPGAMMPMLDPYHFAFQGKQYAKPRMITTMWEDEKTLCYQVEANGVSVVRRADNDMINGTKLLNVTKMTRGRRDGILRGEKIRSVVKIGSMHLKGVWIPFDRAYLIAQKEKIVDLLYPLFVKDIKSFLKQSSVSDGSQIEIHSTAQEQFEREQQQEREQQHEDENELSQSPPQPMSEAQLEYAKTHTHISPISERARPAVTNHPVQMKIEDAHTNNKAELPQQMSPPPSMPQVSQSVPPETTAVQSVPPETTTVQSVPPETTTVQSVPPETTTVQPAPVTSAAPPLPEPAAKAASVDAVTHSPSEAEHRNQISINNLVGTTETATPESAKPTEAAPEIPVIKSPTALDASKQNSTSPLSPTAVTKLSVSEIPSVPVSIPKTEEAVAQAPVVHTDGAAAPPAPIKSASPKPHGTSPVSSILN